VICTTINPDWGNHHWLIDSFYFELIILSPRGKTLQPFKVKIGRSVITNIIQKNQSSSLNMIKFLNSQKQFLHQNSDRVVIQFLIQPRFNDFLHACQSVLQGLMPFGCFKTTPSLFNKKWFFWKRVNNGLGCSSLIILVTQFWCCSKLGPLLWSHPFADRS